MKWMLVMAVSLVLVVSYLTLGARFAAIVTPAFVILAAAYAAVRSRRDRGAAS